MRTERRTALSARTPIALLLTISALLLVVSTVWAHGGLKSSKPGAGAHLEVVPSELRLDFSEHPALAMTSLRLIGPDSEAVSLGALKHASDSPFAVVAAIEGPLVAGTYRVMWQMAGADGHPTRGSFRFTIAPGAAGLLTPVTSTPAAAQPIVAAHHDPVAMPTGADFGVESPAYVAIRWLQFIGLLIAIGAVAFHEVVLWSLRRKRQGSSPLLEDAGRGAARMGVGATSLLALTLVARLLGQSYALHGRQSLFDGASMFPVVTQTTWGLGWILQLVGVLIAFAGFHWARATRRGWGLASIGVVLLAFSPALSGHASSAPQLTTLAILADGVHVMSVSGWLGSLALVLLAGIPAAQRLPQGERGPAVAELVNAFSPTALMFAAAAAATGSFAAWLHVGAFASFWHTDYGRLLLLKLGILSVVAATGAYNWLRVRPALGDDQGTRRVRRSATVELSVAVLVLLVTAILVATPTAMDERAMAPTITAPPVAGP